MTDFSEKYIAEENMQTSIRMPSSGKLYRITLVRTDVSEERINSIIRVTRIGAIGTTLAMTSNRSSLMIFNFIPGIL
jgi:hypothetical protein